MSWFELEDGLSDAVDVEFAEPFIFHPMKKASVNDPSVADDGRSDRSVMAIFSNQSLELPEMGLKGSGAPGYSSRARGTMGTPQVSVDVRQFAINQLPIRLDRFIRQKTNAQYSVTDVQPDGQGRLKCLLVEFGIGT